MAKKGKKQKTASIRHDVERAGALCVAFVNTTATGRDNRRLEPLVQPATRIETYQGLVTWLQQAGKLGITECERLRRTATERPAEATTVLERALDLRATMTRIFSSLAKRQAPSRQDLDTLNNTLPMPQIAQKAGGFRLHWGEDSEALDRVLWLLAESAMELLTSEQHQRLRQCATEGCCRLFVYAHSQRMWCDDKTCGNRSRARRNDRRNRKMFEESRQKREAERWRRSEKTPEAPADAQDGGRLEA